MARRCRYGFVGNMVYGRVTLRLIISAVGIAHRLSHRFRGHFLRVNCDIQELRRIQVR